MNKRPRPAWLFLAFSIVTAGCKTFGGGDKGILPDPVTSRVKDMGFVARKSPSTDDMLGFTLVPGQQLPDTNECFKGVPRPGSGFDVISGTYTAENAPSFDVELKNLFTLQGNWTSVSTVSVTFTGLQESTLVNLKPTFSTDCVTADNVYADDHDIVVSVLVSSAVYAAVDQGSSGSVTVSVASAALSGLTPLEAFQAGASLRRGNGETLVGRNLTLGYKTVKYSASVKEDSVDLDVSEHRSAHADRTHYSFWLKDIVQNSDRTYTAEIHVEADGLPFKHDYSLLPRQSETGFSSNKRFDYLVAEQVSADRVRLRVRQIQYQLR